MPGPTDLLSCSFCERNQHQVTMLIAGAHSYICDGCVSRAHAVLSAPGQPASTPIATIQQVSAEAGMEQCGFCGKRRNQVAAMASAGGSRIICDECLALCDEITSADPPPTRP